MNLDNIVRRKHFFLSKQNEGGKNFDFFPCHILWKLTHSYKHFSLNNCDIFCGNLMDPNFFITPTNDFLLSCGSDIIKPSFDKMCPTCEKQGQEHELNLLPKGKDAGKFEEPKSSMFSGTLLLRRQTTGCWKSHSFYLAIDEAFQELNNYLKWSAIEFFYFPLVWKVSTYSLPGRTVINSNGEVICLMTSTGCQSFSTSINECHVSMPGDLRWHWALKSWYWLWNISKIMSQSIYIASFHMRL